jgi:hypothetical protein
LTASPPASRSSAARHPAADRLAALLSTLAERREARSAAVNKRLVGRRSEVSTKSQMLGRFSDLMATGLRHRDDPQPAERVASLKRERYAAQAAIDRAHEWNAGVATRDLAKLSRLSGLMRGMLRCGETAALRVYVCARSSITLWWETMPPGSSTARKRSHAHRWRCANVRSSELKWRTLRDEDENLYAIDKYI